MKRNGFCIILIFLVTSSFGQVKIPRPKNVITDPALHNFILNLKNAVDKKDKEHLISILSEDILNSFGGNGGIEEFKRYWECSSEDSPLWNVLGKLLVLGGDQYLGDGRYIIPYVFTHWPADEKYSSYQHMVITGTLVNVRDKPALIHANVVGQYNYDIVKVNYDKSYPSPEEPTWYYTESVDGKIKGFVNTDFIWSPIGYRATFELINNKWKMTMLLAGD